MKKIFFAVMFLTAIIFSGTANAQDVYASSKDGYVYYVMSETVATAEYDETSSDGKSYHIKEVTGAVKKIRDGKLVATENWRFVSVSHRRWQYFINGERCGAFNTAKDVYAMEILSAMNTKYWSWKSRH